MKRIVAALFLFLPSLIHAESFVSNPDKTYHVAKYGIVADGTDQTTKVNSLLSTIYSAGGGTIQFGPGKFRFDSQIILPNDGVTVSPFVHQPTFIFRGAGARSDSLATIYNLTPTDGTIIELRDNTALGRITSYGYGHVVFEGIAFLSAGTATSPMIFIGGTKATIRDCSFFGRVPYAPGGPTYPVEDAIWFGSGGSGAEPMIGSTAPCNAFGSTVQNCFFHAIRRGVFGQYAFNGCSIVGNTFTNGCGGTSTYAGIDIAGIDGSNPCFGGLIQGNLFESYGYAYDIKLKYSKRFIVHGNQLYDDGAIWIAGVRMDTGAEQNLVVGGAGSPHFSETAAVAGLNSYQGLYSGGNRSLSPFATGDATWDGERATQVTVPVNFNRNEQGGFVFGNAGGYGPVIKNTTSGQGQEWYQRVVSGTLYTYINWDGSQIKEAFKDSWGSGGVFTRDFGSDCTLGYVRNTSGQLLLGGTGYIQIGLGSEQVLFNTSGPIVCSSYLANTIATGLTATGSSNSDALTISKQVNIVTTTTSGTGVIITTLPQTGAIITVANKGANALLVYPTSGKQIDALTATTGGYSIATTASCRFVYDGTQFRSLN